jgi:hypothetical protein
MSTLRLTTLSNQGGTASVPSDTVINGTAKAWVNFNGTGTVAIRRAFNVSSITDRGTGQYTVNLTSAMPDANFSTIALVHEDISTTGGYNRAINGYSSTTTTAIVNTFVVNPTNLSDCGYIGVAIFS